MWGHFSAKEIFSAFIVLFAIIDITGALPIFVNLREKNQPYNSAQAALIASVILIAFFFLGNGILQLFGVDISSFAIAGSLVLFVIAVEMTFGIQIFKTDGPGSNATIVPIVFPLIAGPGAITALLSLKAEYSSVNIIIALLLNMVIAYLAMQYVGILKKILGDGGIFILRKFFGIILLAISVKLFTSNIIHLI